MKIEGSVVLVTGANRGLGAEYVRQLLDRGASKVYAGARDIESVTNTGAVPISLDVTSASDISAAVEACGDVTMLINNAGIDTPESRTTDKNEKVLGLEVKKRLDEILKAATKIVIRTEKPDSTEKYGRILGWIFIDDQKTSINEQLIKDGFAWEYMGETKIKDFELLKKRRK